MAGHCWKFTAPAPREHTCPDCGRTFQSRSHNVIRCLACRKAFRKRAVQRPCRCCGASFVPWNSRHVYCSQRCRRDAYHGAHIPPLPPIAKAGFPTKAEIAAACLVIQEAWSDEERERHAVAGKRLAVEFLSAKPDRHHGRVAMLARNK